MLPANAVCGRVGPIAFFLRANASGHEFDRSVSLLPPEKAGQVAGRTATNGCTLPAEGQRRWEGAHGQSGKESALSVWQREEGQAVLRGPERSVGGAARPGVSPRAGSAVCRRAGLLWRRGGGEAGRRDARPPRPGAVPDRAAAVHPPPAAAAPGSGGG